MARRHNSSVTLSTTRARFPHRPASHSDTRLRLDVKVMLFHIHYSPRTFCYIKSRPQLIKHVNNLPMLWLECLNTCSININDEWDFKSIRSTMILLPNCKWNTTWFLNLCVSFLSCCTSEPCFSTSHSFLQHSALRLSTWLSNQTTFCNTSGSQSGIMVIYLEGSNNATICTASGILIPTDKLNLTVGWVFYFPDTMLYTWIIFPRDLLYFNVGRFKHLNLASYE